MQPRPSRLASAVLSALLLATGDAATRRADANDSSGVDYVSQIKPLLTAHCVECHGPSKQQAGLRLDTGRMALVGGDSGPAIEPGQAALSRLILAVTGESEEASQMPLDRPPLTAAQIDLLRRWIDEGASHPDGEVAAEARVESDHWAFQPLVRPSVPKPSGSAAAPVENPIDAFVQHRLAEKGLVPAERAEQITLLRRVSLDLIGLLPTPDEVERFLGDEAPGAYGRVVDRLLASPHYGERWGRHWLDVARYADSNGFTIDGGRSMWPYRDWVIAALNEDMPFDQFTIEQIAGDLLDQPTTQQLVATGFHRNTLANQEGGTDDEQFRVESVVDRVSTTSTVWMGLTVACAQCHDHKFDPISQRDFYRLYAIFNNTADNNDAAGLAPKIDLPSPAQAEQRARLEAQIAEADKALKQREEWLDGQLAHWIRSIQAAPRPDWRVTTPSKLASKGGASLTVLDDQSVLAGGTIPQTDDFEILLPVESGPVSAIRLEVLTHQTLPKNGPGLASNGNFVLGEFTVSQGDEPVAIRRAVADHSQQGHDISRAIDGNFEQGWAINVASGSMNVNREAIFVFQNPVEPIADQPLKMTMAFRHPRSYLIGRFRLSTTTADADRLGLPQELIDLAFVPAEERSEEQAKKLADLYRQQDEDWTRRNATLSQLKTQKQSLESAIPTSLIMKELEQPRETFVHLRGNFLQKGAAVTPGGPAVLPPVDGERPTRLELAGWLVDPEHPLTARVTVNRIWQRYFGRGLVETENDFGVQGTPPTHPQLLDWLASEFIRSGWSLKALHRLIVTSRTYQQSSQLTSERLRRDPANKWLARQTRLRLEAETIRDVALAASGLLSRKIGGPPVHPPQPEGIYVLTQNKKPWPVEEDEDRYRRGLYTQFWRSRPHPLMPTFDAPDANTTCTRRVRSNTPLQALTLANDRSFVELAEGLALRALTTGPDYDTGRIRAMFRIALSRPPGELEAKRLAEFLSRQQRRYESDPDAAARLCSPLTAEWPPVEAAPWIATARVVLNLDEFITRE